MNESFKRARNIGAIKSAEILFLCGLIFMVQACMSTKLNVHAPAQRTVSLKDVHDYIISKNFNSANELEHILGKAVITKHDVKYIEYTGEQFETSDKYIVRVTSIRVRKTPVPNVIQIGLQLESKSCIGMLSLSKVYGVEIFGVKDNSSNYTPSESEVSYYSTINHNLMHVNFGFNRKTCLVSMTFFKNQP